MKDKGYPESFIQNAYRHYLTDTPAQAKKQVATNQSVRFITRFHRDHKRMETILRRHCPILLENPHLKTLLPTFPIVTYRRALNVKNKVAPSKLKPLLTPPSPRLCLLPLHGMFQCRKALCKTCEFVVHGQKQFSTKGKTYDISEVYNCSSDFVVYCLYCPCQLLYCM